MVLKINYVGCYAWYQNRNTVDVIEWYELNEPEVFRKMDYMAVDGGTNEEGTVYFEYISISKNIFEILANSIENKTIKRIIFNNKSFSSISSLLFTAENKTIELIVDESSGFYIVKEIYKDGFGEFPMRIFKYLIDGFDKAGFKKISLENLM